MKDEKFSAFIDNELDESDFDEMYNSLKSDQELKQRWQRYHIISDTMQKHMPGAIDCSLADRVMKQLENEPAIIAPAFTSSPETASSKTSPAPSHFFKQVAGFAVAASVMVVAVFMTQTFNNGADQVNAPVAQVPSMPAKSEFARVTEPRPDLPPSFQNRLNKYLANHNQYTNTAPGVLPYARIIGYTTGEKPVVTTIQKGK